MGATYIFVCGDNEPLYFPAVVEIGRGRGGTAAGKQVLIDWFANHVDTAQGAYPTPTQKDVLMEQTKLNKSQLEDWFSNARRAEKKRKAEATADQAGSNKKCKQMSLSFAKPKAAPKACQEVFVVDD